MHIAWAQAPIPKVIGLPTLKLFHFFFPNMISVIVLLNPLTISISPIAFNSHWEIYADFGRLLAKLGGLATL